MNNHDDQLHRLLQQWREIEPPSNFDAQVWRRIRADAGRPHGRTTLADWLRAWLPQPAMAVMAALVIGVTIGAGTGWFSAPAQPAAEQLSFLAPHTLTGALRR